MNTLHGWQSTKTRSANACTHMYYALHNMATLFNNHPYISTREFANWHATTTYVGMVVD